MIRLATGARGIEDGSPAQAVPAVGEWGGRGRMPETGRRESDRREPEPRARIAEQPPNRQHQRGRRNVDGDVVDRVAGFGEPIGRGRIGAERRTHDLRQLGVDVVFVVEDVPDGRNRQQGQHQPGPEAQPARSGCVSFVMARHPFRLDDRVSQASGLGGKVGIDSTPISSRKGRSGVAETSRARCWRRACSAKSSVSTRPLPERTPSFTSNRRRISRIGRAISRWARIGQGMFERSTVSSNPHCSGRERDQCFIRWYSSDRAHECKKRSRREPARPGYADLEVDQTRLTSFVDEDVFALVQVDVDDVSLVHRVQQGSEGLGKMIR